MLKKFENFENSEFKKGDYVWVTSDYLDIEKVPGIIHDVLYLNHTGNSYEVEALEGEIPGEVLHDEMIKMKDYEKGAYKYNL